MVLRRLLICLVLVSLVAVSSGLSASEVPVDPIRRRAPVRGDLEYSVTVGYRPDFKESVLATDGGSVIRREAGYGVDLTFSLRYAASGRFALEFARSWAGRRAVAELAPFGGVVSSSVGSGEGMSGSVSTERETETTWRRSEAVSSVGVSVKLRPNHPLDPTFHAQVDQFGGYRSRLSLSMIRDPTVLTGEMSLVRASDLPPLVEFGIGMGFVANEAINLGSSIRHTISLERVFPPITSLQFRLGLAIDPATGQELSFTTSPYLQGGLLGIAYSFSWQGGAIAW